MKRFKEDFLHIDGQDTHWMPAEACDLVQGFIWRIISQVSDFT